MLPEHKNPIFVSKRPKISEKTPILTQECQFCARKAGKWGSRSQKAHKNADFVLGEARNSTERHATAQQKRRQPFGLSPLKIGGYLLSHMVVQYHRRK